MSVHVDGLSGEMSPILRTDGRTVGNSFSTNWRCMSSRAKGIQSQFNTESTGARRGTVRVGKIARN